MTDTKICSACQLEKPLDEFQKNGTDRHGQPRYKTKCKSCTRAAEAARLAALRAAGGNKEDPANVAARQQRYRDTGAANEKQRERRAKKKESE